MEWNIKGKHYYYDQETKRTNQLPIGIYVLQWDSIRNCFYLDKTQKGFQFDYKIYDLDTPFIQRVLKTYAHDTKNLGILLHGIKGTGKSVTAKILCNLLKQPVILITKKYTNLPVFLNSIEQDFIVFIDEYEKVYESNGGSDELLVLMDGVLENGKFRKVFLLTSNSVRVNENLIQRPSRIRYKKEYGNLPLTAIIEIIDDLLIHKQRREKVVKFVSQLDLITVDIIKSVVKEVNIHDEDPSVFEDVFNVAKTPVTYSVYKVTQGEDGLEKETFFKYGISMRDADIGPNGFDETFLEKNFYIHSGQTWLGTIKGVISNTDILVKPPNDGYEEDDNVGENGKKVSQIHFRVTKNAMVHSSFKTYKF
jgi:hypothetical protein